MLLHVIAILSIMGVNATPTELQKPFWRVFPLSYFVNGEEKKAEISLDKYKPAPLWLKNNPVTFSNSSLSQFYNVEQLHYTDMHINRLRIPSAQLTAKQDFSKKSQVTSGALPQCVRKHLFERDEKWLSL